MTNTIVSTIAHADLGMPMSGRSWVGTLRSLPVTSVAPAMSTVADQACVLVRDIAVATGAFPGASAWSPPS